MPSNLLRCRHQHHQGLNYPDDIPRSRIRYIKNHYYTSLLPTYKRANLSGGLERILRDSRAVAIWTSRSQSTEKYFTLIVG